MTTAKKPAKKKRAAPKGRWITEPYNWTGLGGANPEAIVDGKAPKSKLSGPGGCVLRPGIPFTSDNKEDRLSYRIYSHIVSLCEGYGLGYASTASSALRATTRTDGGSQGQAMRLVPLSTYLLGTLF